MPAAGVYLVKPAAIASCPARQTCAGVGKSGSPTERSITSQPAAFRAPARAAIASVADGSRAAMRPASFSLAGSMEDVLRRSSGGEGKDGPLRISGS